MDYFQSDIFSLGVTLLHFAKLNLPFSIADSLNNPNELKQAVMAETNEMVYSADFMELIRGMLESDPKERLSIEKVFLSRDHRVDIPDPH